MAAEEGWVGIGEVAAHLQVARDTVYRWVDSKGFPHTAWDGCCDSGSRGGRVGAKQQRR